MNWPKNQKATNWGPSVTPKSDKASENKMTLGSLKVRQEYLNVAATRVRGIANGLILQQGPKGDKSRIGITVTKKVGNAVERNFVKRRLRVLAKSILAENIIIPADYVLVGRKAAIKRPFEDLKRDVVKALKRLKKQEGGFRSQRKR